MNPLYSPFKRLNDAREHWDQASRHYFDPRLFRMNINALIQALRSVTFLLQKNKSKIERFDVWYKEWQERMKEDASLKWLVNARNIIVKEGDLNLSSVLRISVVGSYIDDEVPKFQINLRPGLNTKHIHKAVKNCGLPPAMPSNSYVRIERRWVEADTPNQELLDLLSHCWVFLQKLLMDAPCLDQETRMTGDSIKSPPPCMPPNSETRSTCLKYTDQKLIGTDLDKILIKSPNKRARKKIINRYRNSPLFSNSPLPENFNALCDYYFDQARWMMEKDGYHVFLVVLLSENHVIGMHHLVPADQSDKYRMMNEMAFEVKSSDADGIITISEIWRAEFDPSRPYQGASEYPNKTEALSLIAANRSGERFVAFAPITREGLFHKKARLGDTEKTDYEGINILEPVLDVWREAG